MTCQYFSHNHCLSYSGVYIESSMCWIDDSLMSGNCLTGLSVVRGGFVSLSGSDITENGHMAPILIEDAHDVRDGPNLQLGVSIRGGVVEGPVKNNYTSLKSTDTSDENDDKNEWHILKGGAIRDVGSMPSWARQHLVSKLAVHIHRTWKMKNSRAWRGRT